VDIKAVIESREYRNAIKSGNYFNAVNSYAMLRWGGAKIGFVSDEAISEASIVVLRSMQEQKHLRFMLEKEMR